MAFSFFKKSDPICGMKEESGKGTTKYDKWFCSNGCMKEFEKQMKSESSHSHKGCC